MTRFIALLMLVAVWGCSSTPPPQKVEQPTAKELSAFSVVTVTDPDFKPLRNQTISWVSEITFVGGEANSANEKLLTQMKSEVEQSLVGKGYRLDNGPGVDYRVIALVQINDEAIGAEMRQLFRLYPSLGHDSQRNKGMLIVAVARPGSVQALWRGAIKVFLEGDGQLSPEQQNIRIKLAIDKVMASLPKAL